MRSSSANQVAEGGRPNQLIGHGDHKPPRNARLERLPEGTQSGCSAGAESGRHRLRRSPALACNGYLLTVACECGVTFERWVSPQDADADLVRWAALN